MTDFPDQTATWDLQGLLDFLVLMVTWACLVDLVWMAPKEKEDRKVSTDYREFSDHQGLREIAVQLA